MKFRKGDRVRIAEIHPEDSFFGLEERVMNDIFIIKYLHKSIEGEDFYAGSVFREKDKMEFYFYAVKFKTA